jgi:hypothetical protein
VQKCLPLQRAALMRVPALHRILAAERALIDRARLLLDMSKLLSKVSAQQRAAPPKPRGGPMALAGREKRAG